MADINKNLKSICSFYASEWHLVTMLLPNLDQKINKGVKVTTILEKDLTKEMETLLTKLHLDDKKEIINIGWQKSNLEDIKQAVQNNDCIIINGTKEFIEKAREEIENNLLENKIIPAYYNQDSRGISEEWIALMKNSIKTTGGKYSTSRMVIDYINNLYMPLCNLNKKHFQNLDEVMAFAEWKRKVKQNWQNIKISQDRNVDNAKFNAGSQITVNCEVEFPDIDENNAEVQVYFGQVQDNGTVKNVFTSEMKKVGEENGKSFYEATIDLTTGGNFGYTFRVMPKHEMLVDSENLDLVKWIEK